MPFHTLNCKDPDLDSTSPALPDDLWNQHHTASPFGEKLVNVFVLNQVSDPVVVSFPAVDHSLNLGVMLI